MEAVTFSILMVDDDSDDRWLMDQAFKQLHAEQDIKKFIDAPALIRYLETVEMAALPSIIVLDNSLPQMGVRGVLSVIRSNEQWRTIRVVVLMNTVTAEMPDYLRRYGADLCLRNPDSMEELVELARQLKTMADEQRNQTASK